MAFIVKGTTDRVVDDQEEKISRMLKHFQEHVHNKFNRYAIGFFCCEVANNILSMFSVYMTHKFLLNQYLQYGLQIYRYYSLEAEERQVQGLLDPMCEVFPKMAACRYHRYGMGGREDDRHAICILGLNMINDKVFVMIWIWHCFIIVAGSIRLFTRLPQLVSSRIRYFLLRMRMKRYLKNNAHVKHIQHYILNCSIGDWFVLYQMSKNLNLRFFSEYITVLALTVNPDPSIEPEEPELYLSPEDLERRRNGAPETERTSKEGSIISGSSGSDSIDGDEGEDEDEEGGSRRRGNPLLNLDADLEDCGGGGGSALSGKQRMLIKQGKGVGAAKHAAMKTSNAVKRLRNRR